MHITPVRIALLVRDTHDEPWKNKSTLEEPTSTEQETLETHYKRHVCTTWFDAFASMPTYGTLYK